MYWNRLSSALWRLEFWKLLRHYCCRTINITVLQTYSSSKQFVTNAECDYILITILIHWLFIHKVLFSCRYFEPQVLIFRRVQLYTCSIWYCHSLWEFVVACRYTACVRNDRRGKVVGGCLKDTHQQPSPSSQFSHKLCTDRPPRTPVESDIAICCMYTTVPFWRWALEARNI